MAFICRSSWGVPRRTDTHRLRHVRPVGRERFTNGPTKSSITPTISYVRSYTTIPIRSPPGFEADADRIVTVRLHHRACRARRRLAHQAVRSPGTPADDTRRAASRARSGGPGPRPLLRLRGPQGRGPAPWVRRRPLRSARPAGSHSVVFRSVSFRPSPQSVEQPFQQLLRHLGIGAGRTARTRTQKAPAVNRHVKSGRQRHLFGVQRISIRHVRHSLRPARFHCSVITSRFGYKTR
jgi:hypothetical protein